MTVELIAVLSIAALAIIAGFGWQWSFIRDIQRDLNALRPKVAAMNEKIDGMKEKIDGMKEKIDRMNEKIDRGGPASAS